MELEELYKPLERPANYSGENSRFPPVIDSESEDGEVFSSTDSDSDAPVKVKKPKIPIRPKKENKLKQKKYNVWSTRIHEDLLSDTLNSCAVSYRDRSRNVESYDYTLSASYRDNKERNKKDVENVKERKNNKRTRSDVNNQNIRSVGRKEKQRKNKIQPRHLPNLNSMDCSDEEFATDLANKLCEEKESLILTIVKVAGKEKTNRIFKETQRIEREGGMFILNNTRRRTSGGVFLLLVKHDNELTKDQLNIIFEEDRLKAKEELKMKKKNKFDKMKNKITAETNLPELLSRAESFSKFNKNKWAESDQDDVVNPPPTPETDGHADSGDGMDIPNVDGRKLDSYDDDFLDVNAGNDMDLF
ncbi:PREDICTED: phosphorylated adapter RNA export protein [Nicrophorus vespilloides]|uniref:Phosphorylated adapter RNA export protein n=1 Tax=Nicrophorus vespilloides TaxID=110193 RepID=A0ABM1MCP0_NICVS|nr:PREDICTED: phosphorylated adapter RNA export protein [Nicrophorus vespilloides]